MYEVCSVDCAYLNNLTEYMNSPFTTYEWVSFLKKNQNALPILLEIKSEKRIKAYFVGLIVKKFGLKIFGSPFSGWLTPDMGFICLEKINYAEALCAIRDFVFSNLKCSYIQIIDKNIDFHDLPKAISTEKTRVLHIDVSKDKESILTGFTRNGRRDVRASERKGLTVKRVEFDIAFADKYYRQLEDVFAKQNLKPFYSIQKIYDLVESFKNKQEYVLALEATYEGVCVATVLSFGFGNWAYYVGAASYREYQKYLPNELLCWEFIKHWQESDIENIDMVGYREYKMKYNPTIIEKPVIIFEKYRWLSVGKKAAMKAIMQFRKLKGAVLK